MASNSNLNGLPSSFDNQLIQSLMARLQLRPPYLDTNSFLSQNLDEFLLPSDDDLDDDDDDEEIPSSDAEGRHRKLIAREEAKLEKEIIKIIHSGDGREALKTNSGQSVAIGDHNVCVGSHEDPGSEYRVWEWHGHIMFFDEEDGYSAEYIYGNYFERLGEKKMEKREEEEEEEEEESKVKGNGNSGLRDLIGNLTGSVGEGGGRVVHRNSLNAGSAAAKLDG